MTASLELHREFVRRGLKSDFVATGQTGIPVDSLVGDYIAGGIEHTVGVSAGDGQ